MDVRRKNNGVSVASCQMDCGAIDEGKEAIECTTGETVVAGRLQIKSGTGESPCDRE